MAVRIVCKAKRPAIWRNFFIILHVLVLRLFDLHVAVGQVLDWCRNAWLILFGLAILLLLQIVGILGPATTTTARHVLIELCFVSGLTCVLLIVSSSVLVVVRGALVLQTIGIQLPVIVQR